MSYKFEALHVPHIEFKGGTYRVARSYASSTIKGWGSVGHCLLDIMFHSASHQYQKDLLAGTRIQNLPTSGCLHSFPLLFQMSTTCTCALSTKGNRNDLDECMVRSFPLYAQKLQFVCTPEWVLSVHFANVVSTGRRGRASQSGSVEWRVIQKGSARLVPWLAAVCPVDVSFEYDGLSAPSFSSCPPSGYVPTVSLLRKCRLKDLFKFWNLETVS